MKKLLLIACCLVSVSAWAGDCSKLSKIAEDNASMYISKKLTFDVKGKKGFRTYFHSAPSSTCKLNNIFIIPNDSVIAYSEFKNENKTWLYVMFVDKNGNDTEGWVKANDFIKSGHINNSQFITIPDSGKVMTLSGIVTSQPLKKQYDDNEFFKAYYLQLNQEVTFNDDSNCGEQTQKLIALNSTEMKKYAGKKVTISGNVFCQTQYTGNYHIESVKVISQQ